MSIVYPFPVLHENTLDYRDAKAYSAELHRYGNTEVVIKHSLMRDTLVGSLVLQGRAAFYSTVSVRGTTFRCTQTVNQAEVKSIQDMLEAEQVVSIPEFPWSPEVFASSGAVLLESEEVSTQTECDLAEFFRDDTAIKFPAQARLAFKDWVRFFSMGALFQINSDSSIENGAFSVEPARSSRLQITISLSPTLYDDVVGMNRDSSVRRHILCAALSQVFQELWQKQQVVDQESNLFDGKEEAKQLLELAEGLRQYLENRKIPTWEDPNFNPAYSASLCYRVEIPETEEEED